MKRLEIEELEYKILSPYAQKARESKGRKKEEEEDELRTCFQRDRDRILHSKLFRRLKHKTQVFISPEGDHYRTRLTHTLEVAQIARVMARALDLNEDLVEAMALGHDVGHTPFGHAGEEVLKKLLPGFTHYGQSIRALSFLEAGEDRQGLNLSWEVLDGIMNHSGQKEAHTLEGRLLKFADRIAYVNHDIDDSLRAGILRKEDIPREFSDILGETSSQRIDRMVHGVIQASFGKNEIAMAEPYFSHSEALRQFMFDHVYTNQIVKGENAKLKQIIEDVFEYYMENPELLPQSHRMLYQEDHFKDPLEYQVCDYIAGMTDAYLIRTYEELFIPQTWKRM